MKQHGKTIVPRNALAVLARQRPAGAHGPSQKAKRQQARQALQKELKQFDADKDKGRNFPPFVFVCF
ncbi:hypothetical protein [Leeia oryzae]|uniref:hypothetical protein n=1 Tax=Leeia oryzae TaxID=356662 RepID=UPI000381A9DB|nr:hypothetical protein [Leeia oryzae]